MNEEAAKHVEFLTLKMRGWANQIAARFGAPVYLCGSSLTDPKARDVDVRVVLSDDGFAARYGVNAMVVHREAWIGCQCAGTLRYYSDIGKLSRYASEVLRLNIDLQVQSELSALAYHEGKPRVRLDTLDLEGDPS